MSEQEPTPNVPLPEPKEGDTVTCTFREHGKPATIEVKIVQMFHEAPFEGVMFVEVACNPGVFTYSHISSIVPPSND
jgi:hypothetical protein